MMDVEIGANDVVIKMLENRIEQLETDLEAYEKEIQKLKCFREKSHPEKREVFQNI